MHQGTTMEIFQLFLFLFVCFLSLPVTVRDSVPWIYRNIFMNVLHGLALLWFIENTTTSTYILVLVLQMCTAVTHAMEFSAVDLENVLALLFMHTFLFLGEYETTYVFLFIVFSLIRIVEDIIGKKKNGWNTFLLPVKDLYSRNIHTLSWILLVSIDLIHLFNRDTWLSLSHCLLLATLVHFYTNTTLFVLYFFGYSTPTISTKKKIIPHAPQ